MIVKDIMTPRPYTISPEKPVLEALLMMYEHDIRRLPVVEKNELVGIVSDRDIKQIMGRPELAGKREAEEPELDMVVREVMSRNVVTVGQDEDIREAIELIVENRISGLPVLDQDEKLVGVISAIDLLQYCLDLLDQVKQGRQK